MLTVKILVYENKSEQNQGFKKKIDLSVILEKNTTDHR